MTVGVLFVDDEQNVLQGLRRMMRVARKEWDMDFAEGGTDALARMESSGVDVLVSDMRMPGMDGAALISETAKRHPGTIRMVLSGQCEQEATFRLVGPSHQFHSKPCDGDLLIGSVRRAIALRNELQDETVQGLVTAAEALPSPPSVQARLADLLDAPDPAMDAIAEIAAGDIGLAAKVLQLANSGYFGTGVKVARPAQAVQLLGSERLAALVKDYGMIWSLPPAGANGGLIERLWQRAPLCAHLARAIAAAEGLEAAAVEATATAGLLHDAGALLLAAHDKPLSETTPAVGAFLAGLWGLPDAVVEAIARHRNPAQQDGGTFDPATAVHAARALLDERGTAEDALEIDLDHMARLGVAERLPIWRDSAADMADGEPSA